MDGGSTEIVGEGSVPNLGDLERWWNDPSIAAWSFALFGCFLLNGTLLLAFLVRPGLRTISNRFVMNLTASNLLTCAILSPLLIMDTSSTSATAETSGKTSAGSVCAISEGATALVTTSSVLSVLLIAVDQYFAVVDPLRYRARVDKLKSGVLIMSIWLISAVFGLLAFFNPSPRSFWLSCMVSNDTSVRSATANSSLDSFTLSTLAFLENVTSELEGGELPGIFETIESVKVDDSIDVVENGTVMLETLKDDPITYGLIYAVVHSVFAYLLPFAAVCWIYISIYTAAHRNSERTRRTGSRPILASASFCEEHNGLSRQQLQAETMDDFRRIPKISSLSSIDETSETTQPASLVPRRRSFSSSSEARLSSATMNENASSGIVFTVGSQRVEVSPQRTRDPEEDDRTNRVPIATLKAEFLEKDRDSTIYEDLVRSKFRDRPDQRRKSSHDLMYEQMLARENGQETWISEGFTSDGSSDSEDEARYGGFDTLDVPERTRENLPRTNEKGYPLFYGYKSTFLENAENAEQIMDRRDERSETDGVKQESLNHPHGFNEIEREAVDLMEVKVDLEDRNTKSSILRHPSDGRSSRRSSTTFAFPDVILNASECSSSVGGRSGRDTTANNNNATEPSACLLAPIVTITPAPNRNGTLHRVSSVRSTSSYINSLKYRISNGSLFRYREEARAARISALVIVMGLICWSPYVILLVMKNLPQYSGQPLPHKYDVMALSLLILATYVSPLLFGYRSRRVKRELRKFFCFRRELSYKNNRSLMAKKVLKRRHSSTLSHLEMDHKYNIFNCVYGRSRWPKDKVQFVQVPDTALAVETCRSSFSSGASTQISSTSTEEC